MNADKGTTCNRNEVVEPFPKCTLTGGRIVNRLPDCCPLCESEPMEVLRTMLNDAIAQHDVGDGKVAARFARLDICNRCCGVLIANPTVARLRAACATAANKTPPTTERRAISSTQTHTRKRPSRKVTYVG